MNPAMMAAVSKIDINLIIKTIIVIIAFVFGITYLRKYLRKKKSQSLIKDLDKDVNISKLTYPISYYAVWATDLLNAMKGVGTNEQAIYDVFKKLQSKDDVLQLITAFGVEDGETLTQWIIGELGDDEKATLNRLLNDKDINYQI